jgi:dTMP kinase
LSSVAESLRSQGLDVVTTREPGAGPLGAKVRELLLHGVDLSAETELLLFLADRANHVSTIIRPALKASRFVLCDRFADSTLVYQGVARGLDQEFVKRANHFATGGLIPNLTLLFDLPPEIGLARLKNPDRMDRQPLDFHHAVRSGFLRLASEDTARWVVLDATKDSNEVAAEALHAISCRTTNRPT